MRFNLIKRMHNWMIRKNTKILIIGDGQLGSYLYDGLKKIFDTTILSYPTVDITDPEKTYRHIGDANLIINCAAYTNVDKAEEESDLCYEINAFGPYKLMEKIYKRNHYFSKRIRTIMISSETVYGSDDPSYRPLCECDERTPTCIYSKSKEMQLKLLKGYYDNLNNDCLMLCSGWLFGPNNDHNFIEKIKKVIQSRKIIKVVDDQIGSLTSVDMILKAVIKYIYGDLSGGFFNIANEGYASRYEVACFVRDVLGEKCEINKCKSEDYPRPAVIAKNSCLDCSKLNQACKIDTPTWKEDVRRVLLNEMRPWKKQMI